MYEGGTDSSQGIVRLFSHDSWRRWLTVLDSINTWHDVRMAKFCQTFMTCSGPSPVSPFQYWSFGKILYGFVNGKWPKGTLDLRDPYLKKDNAPEVWIHPPKCLARISWSNKKCWVLHTSPKSVSLQKSDQKEKSLREEVDLNEFKTKFKKRILKQNVTNISIVVQNTATHFCADLDWEEVFSKHMFSQNRWFSPLGGRRRC